MENAAHEAVLLHIRQLPPPIGIETRMLIPTKEPMAAEEQPLPAGVFLQQQVPQASRPITIAPGEERRKALPIAERGIIPTLEPIAGLPIIAVIQIPDHHQTPCITRVGIHHAALLLLIQEEVLREVAEVLVEVVPEAADLHQVQDHHAETTKLFF